MFLKSEQTKSAGVAKVNQSIKMEAKITMDVATLPDALQLGTLPEITNLLNH